MVYRTAVTFPMLVLAISLIDLSGCALTQGHVNIAYTPDAGEVTRVAGAEAAPVRVVISDERASKDAVGHKSNGYGMEMAPITADNDVVQTLQSAIESELTRRGFRVGDGGPTVAITLTKFENHFQNGFWSGTATAELVMNVVVKKPNGSIDYTKLIDEQGLNPGVQIMSSDNAQIALDRGLQAGVTKLSEDNAFLASLEAASKPVATQSAKATSTPASTAAAANVAAPATHDGPTEGVQAVSQPSQ